MKLRERAEYELQEDTKNGKISCGRIKCIKIRARLSDASAAVQNKTRQEIESQKSAAIY